MDDKVISSTSSAFPSAFTRKTMFNKTDICKIYELVAPKQSGHTPHSHDYAQMWYVTRGTCEHVVEGEKHEIVVGDAFFLPPNITHSTYLRDESSIICCEFYIDSIFSENSISHDQFQNLTQNLSFLLQFQSKMQNTLPRFTLSSRGQTKMKKILYSMLDEYTRSESYFEDYLYLQLMELLLIFIREYTQSPVYTFSENAYARYRTLTEETIHYIDVHYDEPLTLESVCKASMMSKTYFCYLFKLLTRKTFNEYLLDKRICRAMELLRETDMTVIEVCQTVGFHNAAHFSSTFKKITGVSPSQYRSCGKIH